MVVTNWISIYLLGVLFHTTSGSFDLPYGGLLVQKSEKRTLRYPRSIQSSCGTDSIFNSLGVTNEMNRTSLSILMKKIDIGNDIDNKNMNCNKVLKIRILMFCTLIDLTHRWYKVHNTLPNFAEDQTFVPSALGLFLHSILSNFSSLPVMFLLFS